MVLDKPTSGMDPYALWPWLSLPEGPLRGCLDHVNLVKGEGCDVDTITERILSTVEGAKKVCLILGDAVNCMCYVAALNELWSYCSWRYLCTYTGC